MYHDKVGQLKVANHLPDRVLVFHGAIDIEPESIPLRKRAQSIENGIEPAVRSQETKDNDAIFPFVRPSVGLTAFVNRLIALRRDKERNVGNRQRRSIGQQ